MTHLLIILFISAIFCNSDFGVGPNLYPCKYYITYYVSLFFCSSYLFLMLYVNWAENKIVKL